MTDQMRKRPVDISRDDAREVATVALLLAAGFRIGAGFFKAIQEASGVHTWQSVLGQFLVPVGSSLGLMAIAAVLLVVLSPNGSITPQLYRVTRLVALIVMVLGAGSTVYSLTNQATLLTGLWISLMNGMSATTLGGGGWWIMRHFNSER